MKDLIGQEIVQGDIIAIAQRHGSFQYLNLRRIEQIKNKQAQIVGFEYSKYNKTVRQLKPGWTGNFHLMIKVNVSQLDKTKPEIMSLLYDKLGQNKS